MTYLPEISVASALALVGVGYKLWSTVGEVRKLRFEFNELNGKYIRRELFDAHRETTVRALERIEGAVNEIRNHLLGKT